MDFSFTGFVIFAVSPYLSVLLRNVISNSVQIVWQIDSKMDQWLPVS